MDKLLFLRPLWNMLKESRMKYHCYKGNRNTRKEVCICQIDGKMLHGGLTDRLKSAISLYAFCKSTNFKYELNFISPFKLQDYLAPNLYDWIPEQQPSDSKKVNLMLLLGEQKANRLFHYNGKSELHFYSYMDIIERINKKYRANYNYGELFNELFKPTESLQTHLDKAHEIIDGPYISVVFRFQNLLGDFKEYDFSPLDEDLKLLLINRCIKGLEELAINNPNHKILITSDSQLFLSKVREIMPQIYSFPGNIVHMDTTMDAKPDVYMKSFFDMFLIAGSEHVYCMGTDIMYPSAFPEYAAKINNIPFTRILL